MNLLKFILSLFILCYGLLSCRRDNCNELSKTNLSAINNFNKSDSFIKDIPKEEYGKMDRVYQRVKEANLKLGLEKIDSVYEDFKIRIETDFDNAKKGAKIFSIRFNDNEWSGIYYEFTGPDINHITVDSTLVTPKIGWCNFMNELFSYGILDLPSVNSTIAGRNMDVADGGYSFFEIGSKNKYRFYYYYSPDLMADVRFEEAKKIVRIFRSIDENFSFSHTLSPTH